MALFHSNPGQFLAHWYGVLFPEQPPAAQESFRWLTCL